MSGETVRLRLFEVGGSPKALLLSTTPKKDRQGRTAWVPRSMLEHVTRFAPKPGEWRECEVTMQLWFAEKKGLT